MQLVFLLQFYMHIELMVSADMNQLKETIKQEVYVPLEVANVPVLKSSLLMCLMKLLVTLQHCFEYHLKYELVRYCVHALLYGYLLCIDDRQDL